MIKIINDKIEFKNLNEQSWNVNADFIIENGFPHKGVENLLSYEISKLHNKNKDLVKVLDVGCGTGWLKNSISNEMNYLGVDNCAKFIAKLSEGENCFYLLDIEKKHSKEKLNKFQSDILVSSLSLIEIPFLDQAFKNLSKLAKDNGYLMIISLNPIIEIYRVSRTLNDFENYLELYKSIDSKLSISKIIKSNGVKSEKNYHRILHSPNDYIRLAKENNFVLIDFKDGLNRDCKPNEPAYQYFLFKKV